MAEHTHKTTPPLRLHLIGGSGTGKSYLARKMGATLHIPILDLDEIFWSRAVDTYGKPAPDTDRDSALLGFIRHESWIVEGVYHRWLLPSFDAASHIVVLMPPLWLRQTRIVRRFVRRRFGLESGKKETLRDLRQLLRWNRGYDGDNLVRALAMLDDLGLRYVKCRNAREVNLALQLG